MRPVVFTVIFYFSLSLLADERSQNPKNVETQQELEFATYQDNPDICVLQEVLLSGCSLREWYTIVKFAPSINHPPRTTATLWTGKSCEDPGIVVRGSIYEHPMPGYENSEYLCMCTGKPVKKYTVGILLGHEGAIANRVLDTRQGDLNYDNKVWFQTPNESIPTGGNWHVMKRVYEKEQDAQDYLVQLLESRLCRLPEYNSKGH